MRWGEDGREMSEKYWLFIYSVPEGGSGLGKVTATQPERAVGKKQGMDCQRLPP